MTRLAPVAVAAVLLVGGLAAGADPNAGPVPAAAAKPRDGLGNVAAKLKAGGTVKVAYLGGSITAAHGWRVLTRDRIAAAYPGATVEGIDAAIGGTGSDLGVFRLGRDVLRHRPDLVFVEFAVNDGGAPAERIWRAMEGIVRQVWAAAPRTDVCFVYTFRVGYETDLVEGRCPPAAAAMERLADHYGVPSINVALGVVEAQKAGQLVYQSDVPTPPGVIRFSQDGVHPLDEGHRLYADAVMAALESMADRPPVDHGPKLATPFVRDHWQAAKMVPVTPAMLSGDWAELSESHDLAKRFGGRMGTVWEARTPGSRLSFRFRGSTARLYDLLGPDGGQVTVTVDGETRPKPVPRFDSYCTYHRLATLPLAEGLNADAIHTVTVEVHPEQPDRTPVAFRLKAPATDLKGEKYQGTNVRVGQILLLGDLAE